MVSLRPATERRKSHGELALRACPSMGESLWLDESQDPSYGRCQEGVLGESRVSVSFGGEQHPVVHADAQETSEVLDESAELVG
jgi:hypothetical protein